MNAGSLQPVAPKAQQNKVSLEEKKPNTAF
jgi:hypothetical protein